MIKSDLSICPKRIREAPHAYLRWLLKKAPPELNKKCKEIEHQINVAERRQVEPVFNSELLTVDVLTYEMIEMIEMISAASKENKISIEVAATDKKRKLSAERVKMSKNPPCANCGSAEHGWADCKATTICGLKFCQCARNMACWVEADAMPTKDDLKTAQGRNLPDSLINKLKETRKGKGKQVSAVEMLDDHSAMLALENSAVEVRGPVLVDLPTTVLARIIELARPTTCSKPSAQDLAMVCPAFGAAVAAFYDMSFAADDERLALESSGVELCNQPLTLWLLRPGAWTTQEELGSGPATRTSHGCRLDSSKPSPFISSRTSACNSPRGGCAACALPASPRRNKKCQARSSISSMSARSSASQDQ